MGLGCNIATYWLLMSSLIKCNYTMKKGSVINLESRDIQFFSISRSLFTLMMHNLIMFSLGSKGLGEKTHHFTLLDGEMVIDTLPDSQKQERRYLIYDLMAINQVSVIEVWFICNWLIAQINTGWSLFCFRLILIHALGMGKSLVCSCNYL